MQCLLAVRLGLYLTRWPVEVKRLLAEDVVGPPLPLVATEKGAERSQEIRKDEVCYCPTSTLPVVGSSADRSGVPKGQSLLSFVHSNVCNCR